MASSAPADITFLMSYRCPRCGASLEARSGVTSPWLKCPQCKRGGKVPERVPSRTSFQPKPVIPDNIPTGIRPPEEVVVIYAEDPFADPQWQSAPLATRLSPPRPSDAELQDNPDLYDSVEPLSIRRVVLTTMLFIALMVLLFSYLGGNPLGISIASVAALICLILLVAPTRS